jgi:putative tricarboxylic transport membrane protein
MNMAKRMPMIVSCASLLIVLFYLVEDRNYPVGSLSHPGPGLYPMLVGAMMLIATSVTILEAAKDKNQMGVSFDWPSGVGRWRVVTVVFTAFCYIFLLDYVGDLVVGFAASLAITWVMGLKTIWKAVVVGLVLTVLFHLVFPYFLGVPLPQGSLFEG